jgi:exonuclease SbcD
MPPIKVFHLADVHLGVENYGRLDPSTGLFSRLSDFLTAIDQVIDAACREQADLVVFAGDAYKTRDPSPTYQREFARRIRRLSQAGLPAVLIAGNHDVPNAAGRAHTLEIFRTLEVDNIYVARSPGVFDIETAHGPVQVGTMPWVVRSGLLAREELKNKNLEDINQAIIDRVGDSLNGPNGLVSRLTEGVPRILAVHGTILGATYGSERSVMLGQETILPLSLVKNPHWDYVALGHIHRHQAIEADRFPPVVYSGSIERIDFGEEREDKGYVVAEVERGSTTWEFRKLNARPFVTVRVTADGDDPTAQILDAIERKRIKDAVVRVLIRTTPDRDLLIRESEIRRALQDAFYISTIVHDVIRPERIRLGDQADIAALTPIEALERYLQAKETPPDRTALLKQYAESLLASE